MLYKGYSVLTKPRILRHLGLIYNSAQAIYPFIICPGYIINESNNFQYLSILEHEATHLDRAKKFGILKWYLLYIFSPKFRLKEEVIAYRVKKKFLESKGVLFDVEKQARILSSNIYGKVVKYEEAVRLLSS